MTDSNPQQVWAMLYEQAQQFSIAEPQLADFLDRAVLQHQNLASSLAALLASALAGRSTTEPFLTELFAQSMQSAQSARQKIEAEASADLIAIQERDPACTHFLQAFLNFKGFKALSAYRFAHALWRAKQYMTALIIQGRIGDLWDIDIHPAARIGCGMMMDHASAIVIGETAVVEDDVSLLHGVTLGGRGKERGDRHPKIRKGVFIGTGASILGNIEIGEYATIAAGSVVLKDVPAHATAAGMPARIVRQR